MASGLARDRAAAGLPYVVDYDDAWFHRYESHWLSPLLGHKVDAVMRVAQTVVAGNDFLARRARQAGARHVEIVPSAIDLDALSRSAGRAAGGARSTVGWIGIPLNAHYLTIVAPALRAVRRARQRCTWSAAPVPAGIDGYRGRELPVDRGQRDRAHRRVRRRHHAAARHAVGARQVRLQAAAGDGGGQAGDRLAGGRQPAGGAARRQRLPRRHAGRMGGRAAQLADPELRRRMGEEARKTVEDAVFDRGRRAEACRNPARSRRRAMKR